MTVHDMKHKSILDFWFGKIQESESYLKQRGMLWFGASLETDKKIAALFENEVKLAAAYELSEWENTPQSCLALLLLLDQFPLNIYRNQAKGYLLSEQSIPIARAAIDQEFDRALHPLMKNFFYLPLEHAEDLALQAQAVALFTNLKQECEGTFWQNWAIDSLRWAVRHQTVVEKFGRFPHRNEALGRPSTQAEIEFLKGGVPF